MNTSLKNKIEKKINTLQKEINEMTERLNSNTLDLSDECDLETYHNYQCLAYGRLPQEMKFLKSLLKK